MTPKALNKLLHKTWYNRAARFSTRTAHYVTPKQPPSRLNCSCQRPRESCAEQMRCGEGGWD